MWVILRQNFLRKPRSSRLCAGLSGFFGQQGPKQACPKAKGMGLQPGVPELLYSDRVVWGCGALKSAWWGPSFVLGGAACSLIPVPVRSFPKKSCSGCFWTSQLHQGCATSALSIPRLSCPPIPLLFLCTAHSAAKLSALYRQLIASSLRSGIITPF